MRTTLNRNDDLVTEAKAFVAREKLTLTRLIEEGLALRLHQHQRPMPPSGRPLPMPQGNRAVFTGVNAGIERLIAALNSGVGDGEPTSG